jgi:hypothetical protein
LEKKSAREIGGFVLENEPTGEGFAADDSGVSSDSA